MLFILILKQTTIRDSDHQEISKPKSHWLLDLYSTFATPISILIPLLMPMAFEQNTFESNSFIGLIFFAIPLLNLAFLNLHSFFVIRKYKKKSKPAFYFILYSVLRFLFFIFFIISILLIPIFYLSNLNDFDTKFFSFFLFPFALSTTYLLSISCSFTPGSICFIDTGFNALLDILLLMSSLISLGAWCQNEKYLPYLFFPTFLLIFLRPLNQRYNPSRKSPKTTAWRQILFAIILVIPTIFYLLMAFFSFLFITEKSSQFSLSNE
ncbi:DUF2463 domain-containing protein [Encephalitozoon intestinalis]|nr:DUF2463 domain-containing protein [Encephalitozoon intestinalis]